jgi:alkanesulfonate monooxygenase SsuD/methylene tetrahydromethanopterin reductase-like flavin-dependent oxidoreductase (luciferase family)
MARDEGLIVRQAYRRILLQMGGSIFKGDVQTITDIMEEWYTSKACDGFMIAAPVVLPGLSVSRGSLFRNCSDAGSSERSTRTQPCETISGFLGQ